MKCLVLAAGYATRLYPLTENFPKPLLEVNGKRILNWLLEDVDKIETVDEHIIVSNHKFVDQFEEWKSHCGLRHPIRIIDDGSTENANRLGAVMDIAFAVKQLRIEDDLLVLAGDNLLDFSLEGFVKYFYKKSSTCVMRHYEPELTKLQLTGVAVLDAEDKIVRMEEKPKEPPSNWAVPPFYIYKEKDLKKIQEGINTGCNTDAPGSFISWLCGQCDIYAYEMPGQRYDIGDLKSYQTVQETFQKHP